MKKILFMLTKSPYGHLETLEFLRRAKPGDVVVVAQDAVLGLVDPGCEFSRLIAKQRDNEVRVVVSKPDCLARGVQPYGGIPMVGYEEQVDLICECELFC
jgi:sulfur relay protein TusB/DsrH